MSEERPDKLHIPAHDLDQMVRAYVQVMNSLQAEGHGVTHVIAAGFFALGVATAQAEGTIPEALLLRDVEPFTHGYNVGLAQLPKQ